MSLYKKTTGTREKLARARMFGPFLTLAFLYLFSFATTVSAGNPFFVSTVAFVNRAGVEAIGTATAENSVATAKAYRSGIVGELSTTYSPSLNKIFPASVADGTPAYTLWDVGSSNWPTTPAGGQDVYSILETYQGLNGWTGASYVAGSHHVLTSGSNSDISNAISNNPDVIMEPIPTPVLSGNTQTSLTLQFTGLNDRSDVPPLGTWNDSIVGYTVYRSTNGTSSPAAIGTVAQSAGGTISYVDNAITQGVTYYYRLAVNFRWAAHTPNAWYETTAKGPWSLALSSGQPPDSVKFMTSAVSANATVKAGPITIAAYNFSTGNVGTVASSVVLNLSSNSGGQPRFYPYSAGSCGSTATTSAVIAAGQSNTSFCYSDTKAGSWTVTVAPANGWNPVSQSNETINVGPLDHFDLSFSSPQTNGVSWINSNTVTARDAGGNAIANFSSQGITSALTVGTGASLANNTLPAASFTGGIADLTAQNFRYTGTAGPVLFTVTSSNGKVGTTTATISPGPLSSIRIRDAVAGGGSVVAARNMTVDNTLTLYAAGYDASNNFISDMSGSWTANGTLETAFVSPAASIIFAPSLANTSGIIAFDAGGGQTAETGTITVSPGTLAAFSLPQTISDQAAGVAFDIGPIVALDAKGNTVQSFSATAALSDDTGSISPATSGVFTSGRLNSQMTTITKAQSGVVVTAKDNATGKTGSTNGFSVGHGPLHHFELNFFSPQTNDTTWTGINTISAQDQWNNTIVDYGATGGSVAVSTANGGVLQNGILSPSDFSIGIANLTAKGFVYTGTKGDVPFTATSASGKTGLATVTIQPGSVVSLIIRNGANNTGIPVSTYDMQVGQSLILYAAGYDVSGNYVVDVSGTWGRAGTLDAPPGGLSNSLNYQPVTAYTSGTITFSDASGHTAETGTIHVDRGPIDHFVLAFTSPQIDGVVFSGTNTLTAKDVGGNTITDYNTVGTPVTITVMTASSTLANGVFAPGDFSAGVANVSAKNFTYTGTAGNALFTATSAGTLKMGTTTIAVNAGPLHHFDLRLSPTQLINVPFTGANTLTAKDIGGNTITGFNPLVDNVSITYSPATGGSNTVTGLEGPQANVLAASDDFTNGVANLTSRMTHPGPGGGYTFTAASASGKTGTSGGVEVDVGPLHHFSFDIVNSQRAGQGFAVTVGAYAQDPQGISHLKVSYGGSIIVSDDTGTVAPLSIGPFVNGQATANVTITKAVTGNVLHAKDATDQSILGNSNAFDVQGGSLDHFTFVGTVGNQIAGVPFDSGRVEAQDAWGNLVDTFSSPAEISDVTGSLTPATTTAFVSGILTNQTVMITKAKAADAITFSYLGNQGQSPGFNVGSGPISLVLISDQAGGAGAAVGARTISTDDTLQLYAVGSDVYGNYTGAVSGTWGVTGTLDAPQGGASTNILYAPKRAPQSGTITFDDGAGFSASTGAITVKHGALARFNLSIPASNRVGVVLSAPATLTALDAKDNVVADFNASVDNVTFSVSTSGAIRGLGSGSSNIINTAASFIGGVADLSDLGFVYAGPAGNITITASSGSGKSSTASFAFDVGPLDHFNLLFGTIQKNGIPFTGTNIVQAVDLGNNIITGFDGGTDAVKISATPSDGAVTGLSTGDTLGGGDFVDGIATVSEKLAFTGKKGPHSFTATAASGKKGTSPSIEILPGILSRISISNAAGGTGGIVGDQTLKVGDVLTLWATGYDASDNFIQDQTVSWTGTGVTDSFLDPINSASVSFSATLPGTGVIHASVGAVTGQTGTVTVNSGNPVKLVFASYPYDGAYMQTPLPPHADNPPLVVGKSSGPIIVQAEDIVGNIVTAPSLLQFDVSTTGTGSFSSDSLAWTPYTSFAINQGASSATIYYSDSNTGTYQIAANPQNTALSGDAQPIIVVPSYSTTLVFSSAPQTIKAGDISGPITLDLRDADGNLATSTDDISIAFSSNSPGAKKFFFDQGGVAEIQGLNLPAGESSVTLYYKDTAVSRSLITASAQGATDGYQVIGVNAGDPVRLFMKPGPAASDGQNIAQNYSSKAISVEVFDAFNNLVPLPTDTVIHLLSSNATGDFSSGGTGALWENVSKNPTVTMKAGTSATHFYYRDSALGQVTLTASVHPENGWSDATQAETIYAPVITKLAFVTSQHQTDTNVPSSIITIETQDVTGNAIPVTVDTPVSLITSDSSGGSFATSASGPWGATTAVILAGQSSVNFYYKDATPGTKTIGVSETPSLGWADATQNIVINAGVVAKLAFASIQQSIARNTPSAAIIVQLQDANGYPTVYASDLVVSLSSDSANGAFSTNNSTGPWSASSIVIPAGQSSALFYYRDQQPGTYTLNVQTGGHPWNASQTISVTPSVIRQIALITSLQSIALNTASTPITMETEDAQGNPVDVAADTSVTLVSDSTTGEFAVSSTSPWGITSVIIPTGSHQVTFIYRDSTAGTFTLSTAESPSKGWVDGNQQIVVGSVENTISRVKFTTAPQVGAGAISGGEVSGKITAELRSALGNAVNASQITYIVITSSQPSGRFSTNPAGPFNSSLTLTILPGKSSADFYYTDTIQGTATLTAAEFPSIGWTNDTQLIEVKAGNISQIAFVTPAQTILTGTRSGIISIETRDVYGNAKAVASDTAISLAGNSGTGLFYVDADQSSVPVTSVTIPANQSGVSFYYQDSMGGAYSLTADETPSLGWAAATQSMTISTADLASLVIEPDYALLPTNTNVQMTAVGYNAAGNPVPNLRITWSVTNPAVGSITSDGVLTTGENTGKYAGAVQATAQVIVSDRAPARSLLSRFMSVVHAQSAVTAIATVEVYKASTNVVVATSTPPVQPASSGGGGGGGYGYSSVPSNILLLINDGAPETDLRTVSLSMYATNASHMKISERQDFRDASKWLPYATSQDFVLSAGFGKKTVYTKYENAHGDESPSTSAIISYVSNLSGSSPTPVPSVGIADIVKKYNYVIVNAAKSGAAPAVPQIISPTPNSYVVGDQITVTGTAAPNTVVTLHIHSPREIIIKAVTDESGAFMYNFGQDEIPSGDHQIYASIDETQGSLVGSAVPFNVLGSTSTGTASSTETPGIAIGFAVLLGIWLIVVVGALYVFYRVFTGRGNLSIDSLISFVGRITDPLWWKGLSARVWSRIRRKKDI